MKINLDRTNFEIVFFNRIDSLMIKAKIINLSTLPVLSRKVLSSTYEPKSVNIRVGNPKRMSDLRAFTLLTPE